MTRRGREQYEEAMKVARDARECLAGKRRFGGFWTMPEGRDYVRACYAANLARARRLRLEATQ